MNEIISILDILIIVFCCWLTLRLITSIPKNGKIKSRIEWMRLRSQLKNKEHQAYVDGIVDTLEKIIDKKDLNPINDEHYNDLI